jgi:hypothetical protein
VTGAISDDSPSRTTVCKNTTQQITDQSLSLVSAVKLWNMSLQNTYLTIWKATVYYMIFNMAF